jgi:hypothetical protein
MIVNAMAGHMADRSKLRRRFACFIQPLESQANQRINPLTRKNLPSGIARDASKFLFDADQLVIFGKPVGAREAARLDLTAICRDRQIGNCRIFGLARTV